jgi:hypothetical protein
MPLIRSKRTRNGALLIQVAIVIGLIVFYKIGLPKIERVRARAATADREQAITSFFQSVVVEARGHEGPSPAGGETAARPKRLRLTPEVREVEQELGAPDQTLTGYGGAQHLTWIGERHKLQASFNKGQLYALTMFDLKTGHGETVYESSAPWRSF